MMLINYLLPNYDGNKIETENQDADNETEADKEFRFLT
jgi:hypothetical protein